MICKAINFVVFVLLIFPGLIGCQKISARKLRGDYIGTVRTFDQKPSYTTIDFTKEVEFVITKHNKSIDVLNQVVHGDSLSDGYYAYPNPSGAGGINSIEVKADSVIVIIYESHKFGYIRFKEYRGLKQAN